MELTFHPSGNNEYTEEFILCRVNGHKHIATILKRIDGNEYTLSVMGQQGKLASSKDLDNLKSEATELFKQGKLDTKDFNHDQSSEDSSAH